MNYIVNALKKGVRLVFETEQDYLLAMEDLEREVPARWGTAKPTGFNPFPSSFVLPKGEGIAVYMTPENNLKYYHLSLKDCERPHYLYGILVVRFRRDMVMSPSDRFSY